MRNVMFKSVHQYVLSTLNSVLSPESGVNALRQITQLGFKPTTFDILEQMSWH